MAERVAGGGSYIEHVQGYKDKWIKKKAFFAFGHRLGVTPEESKHKHHRSQNGNRGHVGPKGPVSLAWGKIELVRRWTHPKCEKAWEVD